MEGKEDRFMKMSKKLAAILLSVAALVSLTACNQAQEQSGAKEKITFVLDWTPNTNHTGLYVALANGYFEREGLEVEVVQPTEGGAEVLVASGEAQFGVSFQDSLAPAFAGESTMPVTAVAAVVQHNTSGIISRAGEGMDRPKGLEGHKYATWDMDIEKATIEQVMAADGGAFPNVELIPSTVTDEVSALQSKSVDAIWVFYGWAGIACEVAGLDTDYFAFADIDPAFDFYTPVIIGNDNWLEEHPDAARAFLKALSEGYRYAITNPGEAADILMEAAPELAGSAELVYASQKYMSEQYQADAVRWGEFDAERWGNYYRWLNERELTEGEIDLTVGFTNDYLPEETA